MSRYQAHLPELEVPTVGEIVREHWRLILLEAIALVGILAAILAVVVTVALSVAPAPGS